MPEGQLKVIISSTAMDLMEYRRAAADACLKLGFLPLMMEDLPASDANASSLALKTVDEADIYLGLMGHRYGYVPEVNNPERISLVEMEYNRAVERRIPCLIFLMDDDHPVKVADVESGEGAEKLNAFKRRLTTDRVVSFFKSPEDLSSRVTSSLSVILRQLAGLQVNNAPEQKKEKKPRPARKKAETEAVKTEPAATVLMRGATGPAVESWQQFLVSQNYKVDTDGVFGTGTYNATRDFQMKHGLAADGIAGTATLAKAAELRAAGAAPDNPETAQRQQPEAEAVSEDIEAPPGDSVYRDETSAEAGEMRQVQAEMEEEERGDTESADDPGPDERAAQEEYQDSLDEQQTDTPIAAETPVEKPPTRGVSKALADVVRKFLLASSAAVSNATSDQSVMTTDKDSLGYKVYAEAFRDFIASEDTSTPLTISIEARWGQGKSSLMRMIQSQLDPQRSRRARLVNWFMLQWWRLCWLAATPIWYAGVLIAGLAAKRGFKNKLLGDLAEGLSYTEPEKSAEKGQTAKGIEGAPIKRLMAWSVKKRIAIEAQHPTVWFNAWKYDKEEEIWSALATSILAQIKQSRWWPARIWLWASLQWVRANKVKALRDIVQKIFWPVIFGGLVLLWTTYRDTIFSNINSRLNEDQRIFITWLLGSGLLISLGAKFASILEDPFSISLEKYVSAPDYRQKIGFIGEFETDFKRIVKIVTRPVWGWKPRKLIIFVDDLDRCEPPKSADVIEAINVFLDSEGCVFVLGMDSRAVIASIETKYDKMFQRLQQDEPANPTLGRDFLEKIIQVPFVIPAVSDRSMEPYVIALIGEEPGEAALPGTTTKGTDATDSGIGQGVAEQPLKTLFEDDVLTGEPAKNTPIGKDPVPVSVPDTPAGEAKKEDFGSYGNIEVWRAIKKAVEFLESNPRQIKRFINLFRLKVYISKNKELFYVSGEAASNKGYTLDSLAAWTAFSMRWPLITGLLGRETQRLELRKYLLKISRGQKTLPPKTPERRWKKLPWGTYLDDPDFINVVKALNNWWLVPKKEQRDSLVIATLFE